MIFDYSSLLVATGATAFAASLTFFLSWRTGRHGGFLATCSAAMLAVGASVALFTYFSETGDTLAGFLACAMLVSAFSLGHASAIQFRTGRLSPDRIAVSAAVTVILCALPYAWGFDGTAFIIANAIAAIQLVLMGYEYWRCREESPAAITALSALYVIVGGSYAACAVVLAIQSPLHLSGPPENLAEAINLVVSVLGVTGIGALSVALNHQRLVRQHIDASRTDPLTALMNRRALAEEFGAEGVPPESAILMFDLDHFKSINDKFGHKTGDELLTLFADICRQRLRPADSIFRIGGEEFVAVLPDSSAALTFALAESVRMAFARLSVESGIAPLVCTVSIGMCANTLNEPMPVDIALQHADTALYRAKRDGRNIIRSADLKSAA